MELNKIELGKEEEVIKPVNHKYDVKRRILKTVNISLS
jgi:hypothetical protein